MKSIPFVPLTVRLPGLARPQPESADERQAEHLRQDSDGGGGGSRGERRRPPGGRGDDATAGVGEHPHLQELPVPGRNHWSRSLWVRVPGRAADAGQREGQRGG
ncbi:hypothetical protein AVEN_255726-1 [Araneus ventricosus]|uniref:Uncharacterized protein n=1 Tax=Araneus ventricosus TaxID=182803 RepID=A0A4Y2UUZ0_ARAVE|nr:hypothetical protein AVEN_255726-1 [Araneus ventricosus]